MLWLGLADIQSERDGEMWLDRWAIRKCFSQGEDRLWKQTWGVFENSQSRSLYCEVKELKINVCRNPSSLNLSLNSLISSALIQVAGCLMEQEKCSFENMLSVVIETHLFFFLPEEEPELLNPFELKYVVIYAPFCLSFPLDYAPYIRQHFAYITITPKQNHTYTRTSSYREHDLITFSSTMLEENLYFCYCQKVSW